ncbi:MAG: TonB-dependent receptor [Candidatus Methylomirabilales bacterium]
MVSKVFRNWLLTAALTGLLIGVAWAQEKIEEKKAGAEEEIVRLPTITVRGTRLLDIPLDLGRYPGQVRETTTEEIETSEAHTVPQVIKTEPGVTLYNNTGNPYEPTLDMRGFSGVPVTTTTVILDGVRVNNPDFNAVDWDLIPVKDLQGVQVIPGTASVFGKNALAGVVNLQTRRGGPVPEAKVEVAGGSFGRQRYRASTGGPVGDFDYYLGFTQAFEDGFRDVSESDVRQLFAKVGRPVPSWGSDFTLSYLYVDDFLEQPGTIPETPVASLPGCILSIDRTANCTPGDFADRMLNQGIFNVRQELPAGFSAALNAFVRDVDRENETVGVSLSGQTITDVLSGGVTAQVTHEATLSSHRNLFVVGVEYTRNDFDSRGFSRSQFAGFPPSVTFNETQTDEEVLGFFFQDSFDLIPEALILSAGGRYDYDRIDFTDQLDPTKDRVRTFERFNPMAGLTWIATDAEPEVLVYFSYSEGFRSPTVNELFAFAPSSSNPDLDPAISRTFELGARTRVGEYFEGTLALFQTDVDDEILFVVTDPTTGGGINENVNETQRRGVELTLRGQYGGVVDGFLNYSYIKATFETDTLLFSGLVREGNDIPLVPRNRLSLGINVYPIEDLTFSLTGLYVSEQFLNGDEVNMSKPLDAYGVMNGRVSYQYGPLTVFLQGNNITNAEYEVWGTAVGTTRFLMPAPGANFLAGAILEFSGFYD